MNKLKLNPDKTEVLLVSQKADQGTGMQPVLDGVTLPLKIQVCSLGVRLDSSPSLDAQVSAVARSICRVKTSDSAVPSPGGV